MVLTLLQIRVVHGNQRRLAKLTHYHINKQSEESREGPQLKPAAKMPVAVVGARHNGQPQIEKVSEEDDGAHAGEKLGISLRVARDHHVKRDGEIHEENNPHRNF